MRTIFTTVLFFLSFACFAQIEINSTNILPNGHGMHTQTVLFSDMVIFQSIVFEGHKVTHKGYIEVVGRVEAIAHKNFPYLLVCEKGSFYISNDGHPYQLESDGKFWPSDLLF